MEVHYMWPLLRTLSNSSVLLYSISASIFILTNTRWYTCFALCHVLFKGNKIFSAHSVLESHGFVCIIWYSKGNRETFSHTLTNSGTDAILVYHIFKLPFLGGNISPLFCRSGQGKACEVNQSIVSRSFSPIGTYSNLGWINVNGYDILLHPD